jgi:hypothetical protein
VDGEDQVPGAMQVGCVKYGTEGGVLKVEVGIRCLIDQIISQAKVPVKESRYRVEGDVVVIEVVPDIESILNSILNK